MKTYNYNKEYCLLQLLLVICLIVMFMNSCEDEYLDELTMKGINSHSFKVNGQKWVKKYPTYTYMGIKHNYFYFEENSLSAFLSANIKGDNDYPRGDIEWIIFQPEYILNLPKTYPLAGFVDYYELSLDFDLSKCYLNFTYDPTDVSFDEVEYTNVINGNLTIYRYDSICSGTFNFDIASETDTLYITDGKFDYVVEMYY